MRSIQSELADIRAALLSLDRQRKGRSRLAKRALKAVVRITERERALDSDATAVVEQERATVKRALGLPEDASMADVERQARMITNLAARDPLVQQARHEVDFAIQELNALSARLTRVVEHIPVRVWKIGRPNP